MSLARFFGGGGKKNEAPTTQQAIHKLRETEEMLMKKTEFLEKKIQAEIITAKKAGTQNKRVAIAALKRKKRFEKQLQTIDSTLSTIEFQRETLESANTNVETVKALALGAKSLKNVTKQMGVDDVNEIMDDIAEEMDKANEISETLGGMSSAFGNDIDDDELLDELEELEREGYEEQMLDIETGLPSVPTKSLPEVPTKTKENKAVAGNDMAELEAWAS